MSLCPSLNRNNSDLNHPASETAAGLREEQNPCSLSVCFLFCRGILGLFLDENFFSRNQLSYLRCLGGGGSCLPAPLPGPVPLLHHAWPHGPCVVNCAAANSKTNRRGKDPKKEKEKKTKIQAKTTNQGRNSERRRYVVRRGMPL